MRQKDALEAVEVVAVRIPRRVGIGCPRDRGDARARFYQAPRQENTLAVDVTAIGIAHGRRFAGQESGGKDRRAQKEASATMRKSRSMPNTR